MLTVEQILVALIKAELELDDSQIWVRDQTRKIPNDKGLYITVGMVDSRSYGSNKKIIERVTETETQVIEVKTVNIIESQQISVMSRDNSALLRRFEIITALNSIRSNQTQEFNDIKISRLTDGFVNASSAEGASNLQRFVLNFNCFRLFRAERVLSSSGGDYYDKFSTRVDDEKTIGTSSPIIYLEIPEGDDNGLNILTESGDPILTELGQNLITEDIVVRNYLSTEDGFVLLTESGLSILVEDEPYSNFITTESGLYLLTENGYNISEEIYDPSVKIQTQLGEDIITEDGYNIVTG